MALKSTTTFAREILDTANQHGEIKSVSLSIDDNVIVRARFSLNHKFIDVFYNSQTGTTSYALIKSEERIFGDDNTGGWHLHPKDDPRSHQPSEPVSFAEFLKKLFS